MLQTLPTALAQAKAGNSANICLSSRRLEYVFKRCLEVVFKTYSIRLQRNNFSSSKTSWRHLEDISQDVLKTSWRQKKHLLGISVSNYGLLSLNHYLTNLYFTNLRQFQNALIRIQPFLYLTYFETHVAELIQNRHCRTNEGIKTNF